MVKDVGQSDMVQHIGVRIESESGKVLRDFDPEGIPVALLDLAPDTSACVRFIDPYGDTVFNQLQLPVLIAEIEFALSRATSSVLRERLRLVIAFLDASRGVRSYVRFIGD
jgi:hypothetical protein